MSKPKFMLSGELAEAIKKELAEQPAVPLDLSHFPKLNSSFAEAVQKLHRMAKANPDMESAEIVMSVVFKPDKLTLRSGLACSIKTGKITQKGDTVEAIRENGQLSAVKNQQPNLFARNE